MKESIDARIGRYLSGEMGAQEKLGFEEQIASEPALKNTFQAYLHIWKATPVMQEDNWDVEKGWAEFEAKHLETPATKTRKYVLYWAIAASVLLLLGFTYFFFLSPSSQTFIYADTTDGIVKLADGSIIYLNKESAVTVDAFTRKSRHVKLVGEAFFEISHDPKRPFSINCGKTETTVVGTAFNLKQMQDAVALYVRTGKVIFKSEANPENAIALTSGESAVYRNNKMERIVNPSPNTNAWHTHQLQFDTKMPLTSVIADISEYFGKNVTIENADVMHCRISIPLPIKDPEIAKVLKAVAGTINAKVISDGEKFVIKGGSCPKERE